MGSSPLPSPTAAVSAALLAAAQTSMPLVRGATCFEEQSKTLSGLSPVALFPGARDPAAALASLLLRLGCWSDAHDVAQDDGSREGSYCHAIIHRMEPDDANAAYWFRRVGPHPIFPQLHREAQIILEQQPGTHWQLSPQWDSQTFVRWCTEARRAGGEKEVAARRIAQREWQLLFDWCRAEASFAL